MSRITPAERKRFDAKWTKTGDCHLWTGPLDEDGYGTFYFRRKNRRAHRVGFFICHGDLEPGQVVVNTCGNRHCVNPQHLKAVSATEAAAMNTKSAPSVNRQKTHCKNGHPFDRIYGKQRYCSTCESAKARRLRAKWAADDTLNV